MALQINNENVFPKLFSRITFIYLERSVYSYYYFIFNRVNIFNKFIDLFFISFELAPVSTTEIPLNLSISFHTYSKQVINSVECYIIHNAAIVKERQNNLATFTHQSNN